MKQAIIYCRFSPRPDANDCKSNEGQVERCRLFCDKMGYEVFKVCEDRNLSGGIRNRPALNDAIASLVKGMVLVVDRSDRLARDMLILLTIHHQLEIIGCTVEFADGSPMRTSPESKLYSNILGAFAQYEKEKFSLRTKRGLAKKREAGQWLGKPPVGFRLDHETKQLVEDEHEQEAIGHALYLNDLCVKSIEIANQLDMRYGPFRGKPWSARTVRKIISRCPKQSIDNSSPAG